METKNTYRKQFPTASPIIVTGTGRSGTTLLHSMVNAHPEIAVANEVHFFDEILIFAEKIPSIERLEDLNRMIDQVMSNTVHFPYIAQIATVLDAVRSRWLDETGRTYEDFYLLVMEEYARLNGRPRYGDKTPAYIRYLDDIVQVFPNARILHIVRDPRAVVNSRIKRHWTSDDVVINTLKWKIDTMYGRHFRGSPHNTMNLRYEDLVSDPDRQLRQICDFLNLPFSPEMLEFYKTTRSYLRDIPEFRDTYNPVHQQAMDKWSEELSTSQVLLIEWLAGSLMEENGYQRIKAGLIDRLKVPFTLLAELFKYGRYKIRETRKRQEEKEMVYADNDSLYRMLFKALLTR